MKRNLVFLCTFVLFCLTGSVVAAPRIGEPTGITSDFYPDPPSCARGEACYLADRNMEGVKLEWQGGEKKYPSFAIFRVDGDKFQFVTRTDRFAYFDPIRSDRQHTYFIFSLLNNKKSNMEAVVTYLPKMD